MERPKPGSPGALAVVEARPPAARSPQQALFGADAQPFVLPVRDHYAGSERFLLKELALRILALLLVAGGPALAQPPEPAAVGRDRPLTSTWMCENERSVLLNAHPHRPSEEAWLTYVGTRVGVARTRTATAVAFASADGKVSWAEKGDEGTLAFAGLLDGTVTCRRQDARRR